MQCKNQACEPQEDHCHVNVYLSCRTLLAIQNDIKGGSSSGVEVLWSVVSLGLQVAAQSHSIVRETSF